MGGWVGNLEVILGMRCHFHPKPSSSFSWACMVQWAL